MSTETRAADQSNIFDVDSSHCSINNRKTIQNTFDIEPEPNDANNVLTFISQINNRLCDLQLNHEETNQVYEICIELLDKTQELNEFLLKEKNGFNSEQASKMSITIIRGELLKCSTRYKRDKQLSKSELYVAPEEKAIGVRWTSARLPNSFVSIPRLISNIFHEIPIIKSIISLFERDDFRKEYFSYNEEQAKLVSTDVYTNFSSGNNFKTNRLFANHPNSLQIEIAQDDFEPCNALGSRATIYKLSPVYVSVKNIPPKFASKLSNILLASLCHTEDTKTNFTDWNDVWFGIVSDLQQIEKGIILNDGTIIKGTVISVVSDNLGANTILGLVKNFSKTKYPCRFCLCSLDEIKTTSKEIMSKRRTKQHYEEPKLIILKR